METICPHPQGGRRVWLRHCGIPQVLGNFDERGAEATLDNGFAGFFRLDQLMFPFASSLELARDKQPADVKLAVVARSSPDAWVERTDIVDMTPREQWSPTGSTQQRSLAAYAQGKLRSAFAKLTTRKRGAGVVSRAQRLRPRKRSSAGVALTSLRSGPSRTRKWFATSIRALYSPGMDRASILAASEESGSLEVAP